MKLSVPVVDSAERRQWLIGLRDNGCEAVSNTVLSFSSNSHAISRVRLIDPNNAKDHATTPNRD